MISGTSCYRTAHGDPRLWLASHYESLLLIPDGRGLCVNLHHTTRVLFLFFTLWLAHICTHQSHSEYMSTEKCFENPM